MNGTNLPYSNEGMEVPLHPKFKVPQVDMYDGSWDPVDHLENLKAHMTLPLTLKGIARG